MPPAGASYQRSVPEPVADKSTVPGPQEVPSTPAGEGAEATETLTVGVVCRPQVVVAEQLMLAVLLTVMVGVVAPLDQL